MDKRAILSFLVLVVASLACNLSPSESRTLDLYPSPTPATTSTPFIVQITTTPAPTQTPIVIVVSPTSKSVYLCVTTDENVYLRPSPNIENYPLLPLPKGSRLKDSGSRSGSWAFVAFGNNKSGWVNSEYTEPCR